MTTDAYRLGAVTAILEDLIAQVRATAQWNAGSTESMALLTAAANAETRLAAVTS